MRSRRHGIGYSAPDRGVCRECGRTFKLRLLDGYVPVHEGCAGGGRPPVRGRAIETVHLPESM